jgi:FtsZ-binding cell division protein ZapB
MPHSQILTNRSNNFQSNDTVALQRRLLELQNELSLLEQEEQEMDAEHDALHQETENIKSHNKALFDQISQNQESMIMQDVLAGPS